MRPNSKLWLQPNQRLWLKPSYEERKYSPDQPRVPSGNPDGGQWTDGSAGNGIVLPEIVITADDGSDETDSFNFVQLAGDIPVGDSPEPPKEEPSTSAKRTSALKLVARALANAADSAVTVVETTAFVAKLGSWYLSRVAEIASYNDPPRSLDDLQEAVSTPAPGYDIHHIVEQTQAEAEGYPRELIDGSDNLVRIPRLKHQEINGWYQTKNENFSGLTPRRYLSGRNWDVKRAVGLEALRLSGVLKP